MRLIAELTKSEKDLVRARKQSWKSHLSIGPWTDGIP
jgi:hypothetical protein